MHKRFSFALLCSALLSVLVSCGTSAPVHSVFVPPPAGSAPVSLTMTDDPPSGVSVLFFQVSLTSATLTPAAGSSSASTVSLLENPVQIDVTQLQALSAFLANENVPAGTYSSLSLTFANPQLVIFNSSDTALGSSCAVGSICTLTPDLGNSATVSFTSAPFPLTASSGTPLGLLIDFHLNTVIQSDLSVNLGVANGVTVSQLPSAAATAAPPFGFLTGTVGTVNTSQDQFTFATPAGQTLTVDIDNNTFVAPALPCPSPGFIACLSPGDTVWVQVASVESNGDLLAAKVILLLIQSANQHLVDGTVIGYNAGGIKLLLHGAFPSSSAVLLGAVATVTLDSGAAFAVDANGFTIPSGLIFSSSENLTWGQELQVEVDPGTWSCVSTNLVPGPPPSCNFSTNSVQLEPSQMTGTVTAISAPDFTLTYASYPACISSPGVSACPDLVALVQRPVETTSQTTYEGFNPDSFSGLADNDLVSVSGWIFENDNGMLDPAVSLPVVLAQNIRQHPGGTF
jgi:hypothetical protein